MTVPVDSDGTIQGYYKSDGTFKVLTPAHPAVPSDATELDWNETGPQGPTGEQGPVGADGAQGPEGPPGLAGYELVTQLIRIAIPGDSGSVQYPEDLAFIRDISVPDGKVVTGSGCLITRYYDSPSHSLVDTFPGNVDLYARSGPHPTDSTKWRFQVESNQNACEIMLWFTVIEAG